jgi:hypothetical protein
MAFVFDVILAVFVDMLDVFVVMAFVFEVIKPSSVVVLVCKAVMRLIMISLLRTSFVDK